MFQDAYIKLDRLEVEELLEKTKKSFDGVSFNPDNTVVMARDLPFYDGYRFYDLADHSHMPPARRFILVKGEEIIVLDFTNMPIYTLNGKSPIHLNRDTVKDYVRFFFTFVRGRHGRFIIVESVDDIAWREEPPPAARKSISKLIQPIAFHSSDKNDGKYYMQAQMMFRDSLFQADVTVQPDGLVQLSNEVLLIEDMPVLDDTFGQ
ncbi:MAG TPA: hypothetical protein PKI93_00460 [Alphaproteobacteria bacterium]|nr:hypothetical protein [Alphaproteobacteria bacterium]HNS44702.1 hypothetical protein [Alphaproteobacteria bacterium]